MVWRIKLESGPQLIEYLEVPNGLSFRIIINSYLDHEGSAGCDFLLYVDRRLVMFANPEDRPHTGIWNPEFFNSMTPSCLTFCLVTRGTFILYERVSPARSVLKFPKGSRGFVIFGKMPEKLLELDKAFL